MAVCSINNKYYAGATIYIRAINIERDGEKYGTYYQAVLSYREGGKVKQEVVHLGQHSTAESALESWPQEIQELRQIGRPNYPTLHWHPIECRTLSSLHLPAIESS
jgi:hypothetical protein